MTAWTPEREADVRAIAERMEGEAGHLLRATLAALTDERARREAAERERDDIAELLAPSVSAWDAAGMQGRDGPMLVAERDEARAALAALREAAEQVPSMLRNNGFPDTSARLAAALSASAPIAGRYRASVLREARSPCCSAAIRCGRCGADIAYDRALADAAEKGEGHE